MTAALTLPLTTETGDAPEPGIYPGVPFEAYKRWPYLNASTLVEGLQSMRRLKAKLDGKLPDSDSDAKRFGRAVHCRLLEPNLYPTSFPQVEKCSAKTKPAKKGDEPKPCRNYGTVIKTDGEWLCGVHAQGDEYRPVDFVTPEEAERVETIRDFVMRDPTLSKLHRYPGSECCVVTDLCGVRVKCRIDKLILANGKAKIVDIKTITPGKLSKPGAEEAFAKQRIELHYHAKLAIYSDAVEKQAGVNPDAFWGVIESGEPFEVACVPMEPDERKLGRMFYQDVLDKVRVCQESGNWQGAYESGPAWCPLPQWFWNRFKSIQLPEEIR